VLKKEVWERRFHTKWRGRLHQIVPIKWAFVYQNFHCCDIINVTNNDYTIMLLCYTPDNLSFIRLCCSTPKMVWERRSYAFPSHYTPGSMTSLLNTVLSVLLKMPSSDCSSSYYAMFEYFYMTRWETLAFVIWAYTVKDLTVVMQMQNWVNLLKIEWKVWSSRKHNTRLLARHRNLSNYNSVAPIVS